MRLLVVEDDPDLSDILCQTFEGEGYAVETQADGADALALALQDQFDAIVLDVNLPGATGYEVCEGLRAHDVDTPILMLTCRDETEDVVRGLRTGADDYLTKPFAVDELLARIEALGRRASKGPAETTLTFDDLQLDPIRRVVTRTGRTLDLTAREFDLLVFFLNNPDKTLSREMLREAIWAGGEGHTLNVVDVYVGYLRKKVDAGASLRLIHTVRGQGYRFGTS